MKVQYNVNSGANVHSNNASGWFDTVEELGLDEGEWESLIDNEKWDLCNEWAQDRLDIFYEEKP